MLDHSNMWVVFLLINGRTSANWNYGNPNNPLIKSDTGHHSEWFTLLAMLSVAFFQIKKCHSANLEMDLLTTKIVTMGILGSVSLLIGFIPMLVAKKVRVLWLKVGDMDCFEDERTMLKAWRIDHCLCGGKLVCPNGCFSWLQYLLQVTGCCRWTCLMVPGVVLLCPAFPVLAEGSS